MKDILSILGLTLGLVLLSFVRFNLEFFQAQGRYMYPALLPISVLWVLGLRGLLPERHRGLLPYIAVGIPLIIQIVALSTCIVPEMPYV